MTTEVLVVRHGETAWNKEGRLQGQHDPPLNDQGRTQVEAVARYLATQSRPSAAVYTSDLVRAEATAVAISERVGAKVVVKGEFREKGLGVIEGLTFAEARVKVPEAFDRWRKGKGCPGAEDPTAVRNRIAKGLDEIERDHRGEQVIVVTHGGILNSIHKLITGTKFPGKIPNTSISTIRKAKGEDQWTIESFANCSHLVESGVGFDNRAFGGVGETG